MFLTSLVSVTAIFRDLRQSMLFETIVTETCSAAIGPLEYCGHAKVLKRTNGTKW